MTLATDNGVWRAPCPHLARGLQVLRHASSCVALLVAEGASACELVASLTRWPHLLECDAGQEWEARLLRLALHLHRGAAVAPPEPEQARWEAAQREAGRCGELSAARTALLDSVAFSWGVYDSRWERGFDAFVAWLDAGRPGAPTAPLADWLLRQVTLLQLGLLPVAAQRRLHNLGFPWPRGVPAPEPQPQHKPRAAAAARGDEAARVPRTRGSVRSVAYA